MGNRLAVFAVLLVRIVAGVLAGAVFAPSAVAQDVVSYYHVDAVGSVRAVTDHNGGVVARYEYFPFGEADGTLAGRDPHRFASQERDAESGMDYFGARYYASRTGRFTTVDPLMNTSAALTDPQRWNRYTYSLNNPFRFVDPDGRDPVPTAWNTGRGADGLARVIPAVGKALWNIVVSLNSPGHPSGSEAEARRDAQFMRPSNSEEAVIMGLTDVAMLAAPLMRGVGSAAGLSVGEEIGILRDAARGRGNFGLGSATADDAARLGEAWVGKGHTVASDGKTLISADGLRQYRPPTYKPNLGRTQSNFEWRPVPRGAWGSNGHLDIYPE